MKSKTCGECKWYDYHHLLCVVGGDVAPTDCACDSFIGIKLTNGDKIRQMSNEKLAELLADNTCTDCGFFVINQDGTEGCTMTATDTCKDGILAWLNAPAESEEL